MIGRKRVHHPARRRCGKRGRSRREAQQPNRIRRLGALMGSAADDAEVKARMAVAFEKPLQELGWSLGRDI